MTTHNPHRRQQSRNPWRLLWGLYLSCALSLALEFVIHRHVEDPWEQLWGFHALFGFGACALLVLSAALLRRLLKRGEDYYSRDA